MLYYNKYFVFWLIATFILAINASSFSMGSKKKYGENTIFCAHEHQNPPDTKYCTICGEQIPASAPKAVFCPDGHKNLPDSQFCQQCGKQIVPPMPKKSNLRVCPDGHENPNDAKFCKVCGKELTLSKEDKEARYCPDGHKNNKEAAYCYECGKKIPPQKSESNSSPTFQKDRSPKSNTVNLIFWGALAAGLIIANYSASLLD